MKLKNGLLSLLLVMFFSISIGEETQWLGYKWGTNPPRWMTSKKAEVSTEKPEGIEIAEQKGLERLYGSWQSAHPGGKIHYFALEKSYNYGPFDVLYFDTNGDGKLTEKYEPDQLQQNNAVYSPVPVILQTENGPFGFHISLRCYNHYGRAAGCSISPAGWYEGYVDIGGTQKYIYLFDNNGNGRFGDFSINFSDADNISLGDNPKYKHFVSVGKYIEADSNYYRLELASDGASFKVEKAENLKLGRVILPEGINYFQAGGINGMFQHKLEESRAVQFPAGSYRIDRWRARKEDKDGINWGLTGKNFGDKGLFEVSAEKETTLDFTPKLVSKIIKHDRDGEFVFQYALKGSSGEAIEIRKKGGRPPAPEFLIENKDKTYSKKFTLEYG